MDLNSLTVLELLEVAEEFGTEAGQDLDSLQIIARLEEDGVQPDMVKAFFEGKEARARQLAEQEEKDLINPPKVAKAVKAVKKTSGPVKVEVPDEVLLYMERENPTYMVRGYKFTYEHPFALVKSEDAEFIVEEVEGFSYATPKQAREYYS